MVGVFASLAQLVEHEICNPGVVGSNPTRGSIWRDGENGRHDGFKIHWPVMAVWVRTPLALRVILFFH